MRVQATFEGNVRDWVEQTERRIGLAVKGGVEAAGKGAQQELRRGLRSSGLNPRVESMVGLKVYPSRRGSMSAAAVLHARGPQADAILTNVTQGALIRPINGRNLAIPTGQNLVGGRRGARLRITPQEMARLGKLTFVIPTAGGDLLWCVRVTEAQSRSAAGRVSRSAYAGGVARVRGSNKRGRNLRSILRAGFVPMFVLTRSTRIRKRIDAEAIVAAWANRIPGFVDGLLRDD